MKIDGTITDNLRLAIASAQRLRGHPVYPDTIAFWRALLHEGRRARASAAGADLAALDALIESLEHELAERPAPKT